MSSSFKKIPNISLPYEYGSRLLLLSLLSITTFLLAGGLYNFSENPSFMSPFSKFGFHPLINEQFIYESGVSALVLFLGMGGFLKINVATKYAYDVSKSITNLIIGMLIVFLAAYTLLILFYYKTGSML
jgi:hypothetical protein